MITLANLGPLANNAYVLSRYRDALVIDAPPQGVRILEALEKEKVQLKYVLITHGHPDHVASVNMLREETGATVVMHAKDIPMVAKAWNLGFLDVEPFKPDLVVEEGEEIRLGSQKVMTLRVLHTPGHTQGSVCFYLEKEHALFTGDTLFARAIGRTDLPDGNFDQLMKNIKERLFALPEATRVFPGHGKATTIGNERAVLK